jgi:hypothetical protein
MVNSNHLNMEAVLKFNKTEELPKHMIMTRELLTNKYKSHLELISHKR